VSVTFTLITKCSDDYEFQNTYLKLPGTSILAHHHSTISGDNKKLRSLGISSTIGMIGERKLALLLRSIEKELVKTVVP